MEYAKCAGCGYCCITARCRLSLDLYHDIEGDCPALHWNGERYVCQLAGAYKDELYIGAGCSSSLNDWRGEVKERS